MRFYSDVVHVDKKVSKDGKNGKPYYALRISYKYHSEKKNQDFDIKEFLFLNPELFKAIDENTDIILEGIITRDKDSHQIDLNYYDFRVI